MYHAVMSNTLNSIMLTLRNGLDTSQNITNTEAVVDAVAQLELFPMTMSQLQDTRIGQLLQTIRHKVDPALQKRIRFVIKAWQKLLSPDFTAHSVIPLKCADLGNAAAASPRVPKSQHSNGTPVKPMLPEKPNSAQTVPSDSASIESPRTHESRGLKRSYPSASNLTNVFAKASDPNIADGHNQLSDSPSTIQRTLTPNKRLRLQPQSVASPQVKPSSAQVEPHPSPKPLVNGGRHIDGHAEPVSLSKPTTPLLNKSNTATVPLRQMGSYSPQLSSRDVRTTQAARLAKVKSTAELVQAAGDCIDSATADRILTNRISKEADPPRPSIVPQLMRTRQPRVTSSAASSNAVQSATCDMHKAQSTTPRSGRSTGARLDIQTKSTPTSSDFSRSEVINNQAYLCKSQVSADRITPASAFPSAHKLTTGMSTSSPATDHRQDSVKRPALSESETGVVDTDSDTQRSKHKKRKKHHKHRHKHRGDWTDASGRSHRHGEMSPEAAAPPITNHLDDWPQLPPLPTEIDWYSLDRPEERPEVHVTPATDTVTRLLSEPWPEVNRTVDNQGLLHLPTELYSLTIDDQYLHILPWVDIVGHRRQFFPPSDDLDQLTILPEPW